MIEIGSLISYEILLLRNNNLPQHRQAIADIYLREKIILSEEQVYYFEKFHKKSMRLFCIVIFFPFVHNT